MASIVGSPELAARTSRRLLLLHTAHIPGAFLVWLWLELASPPASRTDAGSGTDLIVAGIYVAVAMLMGNLFGARMSAPATAWCLEAREPTPEERAATLALPWRCSAMSFAFWLGAAVLFFVLNLAVWHQALSEAVYISDAIVLGGLTTSALTYLLCERALRPLFARALASGPPPKNRALGLRPRLLLAWALGSGVDLLALALLPIVNDDIAGSAVITLSLIGLAVGALMTVLAAQSLADPVLGMVASMAEVQRGNLDVEIPVDDGGEVGRLQSGFNRMVEGLRERHRLQDLFGRQVGEQVARQALERGIDLEGDQCEASILFVDLIGSTAMALDRPPAEVVATLNALFSEVIREANQEGGWVNRFEGDGALCVFGAPVEYVDHAARALRAARAVKVASDALGLDVGIGVSSGTVVAGNVGTRERYEYTVIGDPVNEAARLTDAAKLHPGRVLASEASLERAGMEGLHWRSGEVLELRGRSAPTLTYAPAPVSVTEPTTGP